uniref:Uncharacterized protein n=1 Tax=Micrurus carvalhoi TaxID=3147026 RepID=A0A2H6N3F1_9SAUR
MHISHQNPFLSDHCAESFDLSTCFGLNSRGGGRKSSGMELEMNRKENSSCAHGSKKIRFLCIKMGTGATRTHLTCLIILKSKLIKRKSIKMKGLQRDHCTKTIDMNSRLTIRVLKKLSVLLTDLVILSASEDYKKTNVVLIQKKGTKIWEILSSLWKTIEQCICDQLVKNVTVTRASMAFITSK